MEVKIKKTVFIADAGLQVKVKGKTNGVPDTGSLSGTASAYGVVDQDGEIILAGAFRDSLAAALASGGIPLMSKHFAHGGDGAECIGTIKQAHEDTRGLMIDDAPFSSDADAQAMRQKITGKHVRGLSVGFYAREFQQRPAKDDYEKTILAQCGKTAIIELTRCDLVEVTVTCRPCNLQATITGAKAGSAEKSELQKDCEAKRRSLDESKAKYKAQPHTYLNSWR